MGSIPGPLRPRPKPKPRNKLLQPGQIMYLLPNEEIKMFVPDGAPTPEQSPPHPPKKEEDDNYKIKEIDWDNGFNLIDIKGKSND